MINATTKQAVILVYTDNPTTIRACPSFSLRLQKRIKTIEANIVEILYHAHAIFAAVTLV